MMMKYDILKKTKGIPMYEVLIIIIIIIIGNIKSGGGEDLKINFC